MIWLPRTTDNSTYFAQSLEIRGIESRLYIPLGINWNISKGERLFHCGIVRGEKSSSGHHCTGMSGIYNIGHCVMPW